MIRITAKRLLMGKVFAAFAVLSFGFIVSAFGAFAVALSVYGFLNVNVNSLFLDRFGEYAFAVRIAVCVLFALVGLLVFALGKNIRAKRICRTVSDDSFVCSLKKSAEFLLCFLMKTLFALCWGFVYLLPCVLCTSFLVMSLSQGAMERNIFFSWVTGSLVLFILGLFFTFVTLQRYSLWTFYLCREGGGAVSALYKSLEKTNDRCMKIAFFKFSMIGWILSCFLVLPVVYVLPYYSVSVCLFELDIKDEEKEKKREEIPPAVFKVVKDL